MKTASTSCSFQRHVCLDKSYPTFCVFMHWFIMFMLLFPYFLIFLFQFSEGGIVPAHSSVSLLQWQHVAHAGVEHTRVLSGFYFRVLLLGFTREGVNLSYDDDEVYSVKEYKTVILVSYVFYDISIWAALFRFKIATAGIPFMYARVVLSFS